MCFEHPKHLLEQPGWDEVALIIWRDDQPDGTLGRHLFQELTHSQRLPPFTLLLQLEAHPHSKVLPAERPPLSLPFSLSLPLSQDSLARRLESLVHLLEQQAQLRQSYRDGQYATLCGQCEDLMLQLEQDADVLEPLKGEVMLRGGMLSEAAQYFSLCIMEQGEGWAKAGLLISLLWQGKLEAARRFCAQQKHPQTEENRRLQLLVDLVRQELLDAQQTVQALQQQDTDSLDYPLIGQQLRLILSQPPDLALTTPYRLLSPLNTDFQLRLWQLASIGQNWQGLPSAAARRNLLNQWRQLASRLGPSHCPLSQQLALAQQACYQLDYRLARERLEPLRMDEEQPATSLLFGASVAELVGLTRLADHYLNSLTHQLIHQRNAHQDILEYQLTTLLLQQARHCLSNRKILQQTLRQSRQHAIAGHDFFHALQLSTQLVRDFGAQPQDSLIALELLTRVWPSKPVSNQFNRLLGNLLKILDNCPDMTLQQQRRFNLIRARAMQQRQHQMALRQQQAST